MTVQIILLTFKQAEGLSFYHLIKFVKIMLHFSVWDSTRFKIIYSMVIITPSPIVHPMELPPVRSVHFSEKNHDPVFLGSAIPRWHNLSIQVRLFEFYGVIQTAFGMLFVLLNVIYNGDRVVVCDEMHVINVYQCNDLLSYFVCRKYQSNKCVSVRDLQAVSHSNEICIDYTF